MKYYIDTEFIENQNYLELISIGIKCEDGRTFYTESHEVDEAKIEIDKIHIEHNALSDAIWNEELYKHIKKEKIRLSGVSLWS